MEFPSTPLVVVHPLTGDIWNVAPLLQAVHELGQGRPDRLAEALYDSNRYISLVQGGPNDTAARLRAVLQLLEALGLAFDSVHVQPLAKN